MLAARLAGADLDACLAAERARGLLPRASSPTRCCAGIAPAVEPLVAVGQSDVEPSSLDVNVSPSRRRRRSSARSPTSAATSLHTVTYSALSPAHRLIAWVAPARPQRGLARAAFRGRDDRARPRRRRRAPRSRWRCIPPLGADAGQRQAAGRSSTSSAARPVPAGMREPLPLYQRTSAAWAEATDDGGPGIPRKPAAGKLLDERTTSFREEDGDPEHVLVLGGRGRDSSGSLAAAPALPSSDDEDGRRLGSPLGARPASAVYARAPLGRPARPRARLGRPVTASRHGPGARALRRSAVAAPRRASPCSRPAPAPARRSPSPPWPPATWPTGCPSTGCSS